MPWFAWLILVAFLLSIAGLLSYLGHTEYLEEERSPGGEKKGRGGAVRKPGK